MTAKIAKRRPASTRAGRRILSALTEAVESARRGERPEERFRVRTVEVPDDPRVYDAAAVRSARDALGVSQAVFAKLLGVSLKLVQGWEQGQRVPSPLARRLLDVITQNPNDWRQMVRPKPFATAL